MSKPVLIQVIPDQVINELSALPPFNLTQYIQTPEGSAPARFSAALADGRGLPSGMICTPNGELTGIPARNTQGVYEIVISAENEEGETVTQFTMIIKQAFGNKSVDHYDQLKAQVWDALHQNLPIPDIQALYDMPITQLDIYYLLERWGILTIWDAFNLEPASEKHLLVLEGCSQHYNIYDRGSSLVMAPKDLYSHERTLADSIQTAKVMAREIYQRGWTIEMAGLDKLTRIAWVELQQLGDQYGKHIEIINYQPSAADVKLYNVKALDSKMGME